MSIHDPAYLPTRYRVTLAPACPAALGASDVPALLLASFAAIVASRTYDARNVRAINAHDVICARCAATLPPDTYRVTPVHGPGAYRACGACGSVTHAPTLDMRTTRLSVSADNL